MPSRADVPTVLWGPSDPCHSNGSLNSVTNGHTLYSQL